MIRKIQLTLSVLFFAFFLSCGVESDYTEWTKKVKTGGDGTGHSIAFDNEGHFYVTGGNAGFLEGVKDPLTNEFNIFLIKFSKNGKRIWSRLLGSNGYDFGYSVAVDNKGSVYVTGYTKGDLDGNKQYYYSEDVFLTKYTKDGDRVWTKQWGSDEDDYGLSVGIDSKGDIFVTGLAGGSFKELTEEEEILGEDYYMFLSKFNSDGKELWTKQWADDIISSKSLVIDKSDNVFISGDCYIQDDIYIMKVSNDGEKIWEKRWASKAGYNSNSIALDNNDNIIICGEVYGSLEENESSGYEDFFISKYDSKGKRLWIRQYGSEYKDIGKKVTTDNNNNIIVIGITNGDLNGNISFESYNYDYDIFVMKTNQSGEVKWTILLGNEADDFGGDVAVDALTP